MDKRVLITGSSRGIGAGIALYINSLGYEVVLHGSNMSENLKSMSKKIPNAKVLVFDITNTEQTKKILSHDIDTNGVYYGVILNAGIAIDNTFVGLQESDWKSVIDTNLNSFYNVLNPVLMPMIRKRKPARIITMSSISGVIGNRGQTNYSASKAGIIGASKSLALELASRKITVNCIAPGLIDTDMINENMPFEELIKAIPAKRVGKVEDVAPLAGFLLSDEASYITRQVIGVNGGLA